MKTEKIISQEWFNHSNEALDKIESVKDVARDIIAWINTYHMDWFSNNDARSSIVTGTKKVLTSTQLSYLHIRHALIYKRYWDTYIKESKVVEITDHINTYNVMILQGWLNTLSTVIEESFRAILSNIEGKEHMVSEDFKNIYDALLSKLDRKESVVLYDLFRLVRNGIHTNYIFMPRKGNDIKLLYKGKEYLFVTGKRIDFLDFNFINELTRDLLVDMGEIIKHPKIADKNHIKRLITMAT